MTVLDFSLFVRVKISENCSSGMMLRVRLIFPTLLCTLECDSVTWHLIKLRTVRPGNTKGLTAVQHCRYQPDCSLPVIENRNVCQMILITMHVFCVHILYNTCSVMHNLQMTSSN